MLHFYTKSNASERNRACYDIAGRSLSYSKVIIKNTQNA